MGGLSINNYRANDDIEATDVIIIGETERTECSLDEALKIAESDGLDLVQVGKDKDGKAMCKIFDISKRIFEDKKKQSKDKAHKGILKEVRMGNHIALADLEVKAKTVSRILKEGDKVKIVMQFKGREARNVGDGAQAFEKLQSLLTIGYTLDKPFHIEGNRCVMVVSRTK